MVWKRWFKKGRQGFSEHPIVEESHRWIDKRSVAFILAYGAVVLGVWAEFDGELGNAIGRAITNGGAALRTASTDPLKAPVHVRTWVFCSCLVVIATLLWKRLKADDRKQDERTLDVLRALYRVPNISVIRLYSEQYWPQFMAAIRNGWPDESAPEAEQLKKMAHAIQRGLAVIVKMTQEFTRDEKASFGANIMLVLARDTARAQPFPAHFVDKLIFHSKGALDDLAGMLYLPDDLVVENLPKERKRTIARIVLPVPYTPLDDGGRRLVIPGAPAAVVSGGGPSVHEDTRKIASECGDFSASVRDEIENYFSAAGAGKDVLSFASFRLGNDTVPIGVLNVDSDRTHVLGKQDEFYVSYYALMRPMLDVLADAVIDYAALVDPWNSR